MRGHAWAFALHAPFYFPKRWIMIPKIEPQADAQYIYVKKEAFTKEIS